MLPLISFETGRKTQTQSCGQPAELRQPMEVWFYPRIGTAAERPTPRAEKLEEFTPALLPARRESFCPLDKDLSWKSAGSRNQLRRLPVNRDLWSTEPNIRLTSCEE